MEKKDRGYEIKNHKEKETKGNKMLTNKLRTNKIPRKNNKFAQESNTTQLPTKEKKKIFIVSNFMFKILLEQVFQGVIQLRVNTSD